MPKVGVKKRNAHAPSQHLRRVNGVAAGAARQQYNLAPGSQHLRGVNGVGAGAAKLQYNVANHHSAIGAS